MSKDIRHRRHLVIFDDPEKTIAAVKHLRRVGFIVEDVHTPFPLHGLDEALGLAETRLPWITFIGGAIGCLLGLGLQIWTHAVDWPLDIGGKSNVAFPATIPVAFETTILLAAFSTVIALFVRSRLFPGLGRGAPRSQPIARVSDDRFVVVVREQDGSFSSARFKSLCLTHHPESIVEEEESA